jgi:ubiquinone/menaquinone biosynthesis C-methylase UbiE
MNRTEKTALKYRGDIAKGYDERRASQIKWKREHEIISDWLKRYEYGTTILDCPVGTGRFVHLYEKFGLCAMGIDISEDMLSQAMSKDGADRMQFRLGSIFDIGQVYPNVTLAIRIMNLIELKDMQRALIELQRVTQKDIIFNLREKRPGGRWKHAHPLSAVESALQPWWTIAENVPIHEDDFRMIKLSRHAMD